MHVPAFVCVCAHLILHIILQIQSTHARTRSLVHTPSVALVGLLPLAALVPSPEVDDVLRCRCLRLFFALPLSESESSEPGVCVCVCLCVCVCVCARACAHVCMCV